MACRSCHNITPTGINVVGPTLFGVIGRRAGAVPGYTYSGSLRASGIVWTDAALDRWMRSSRAMVPGTKEHFLGLSNSEERENIIAFLRTAQ